MKVFLSLLLAVVSKAAPAPEADPVLLTGVPHHAVPYAGVPYAHLRVAHHGAVPAAVVPYTHHAVVPDTHEITYKTITPTVETNVVATNAAVPVSVGGYKAVAGDNGALKGAVHEVPAKWGAPALNKQVNDASQGSLTVGTTAFVTHKSGEPIVKEHKAFVPTYGVYGYGKREAVKTVDAPAVTYRVTDYFGRPIIPAVTYGGVPAAVFPYTHHAVVPDTHEFTYKSITPSSPAAHAVTYGAVPAAVVPYTHHAVVATNAAVPVSVGGYKAVAGDNGALKGAVHEVPATHGCHFPLCVHG